MASERVKQALDETAMRLDILISRGDISEDPQDEQTSKGWLKRVRAALRELEAEKLPACGNCASGAHDLCVLIGCSCECVGKETNGTNETETRADGTGAGTTGEPEETTRRDASAPVEAKESRIEQPAASPGQECECPMRIIRYMQKRAGEFSELCGDRPLSTLPSEQRYYRNAGASTAIYNLANEIGSLFVNSPCPVQAEVARLRKELKAVRVCSDCNGTGIEYSGVCHCGLEMEGHSVYENHAPVEMTRSCETCTKALQAELTRLRAELAGAREALKPFKDYADSLNGVNYVPDACPVATNPTLHNPRLTVGDIRRAAQWLAGKERG